MIARLLVRFSLLIEIVFAATHWLVTQDGRIAPQVNLVKCRTEIYSFLLHLLWELLSV